MNKKQFLDYLFYRIGNQETDFKISGLQRTEEGDKSTKWYPYSEKVMTINPDEDYKINWANQRQILPCEIVIDLEERETFEGTILRLKKRGIFFYAYDTGSRGYHIHIFFDENLSEKQKRKYIQRYSGDEQLASGKHMINLEYAPHWKSGKIKRLVAKNESK